MNNIEVTELKKMLDSNIEIQLIDIREEYELETEGKLNSTHIPMGTIMKNLHKLKSDIPVIFYCRVGRRTKNVLNYFEMKGINKKNYFNLLGGITAWKENFNI